MPAYQQVVAMDLRPLFREELLKVMAAHGMDAHYFAENL